MMHEMERLNEEVATCSRCPLSASRTQAVPGEGPANARILFIGEAPGKNEDLQGRPFVGRAGRILDELLASIDLERNQVYITNIVKCRPPKNRDPTPAEITACHPYLERQIAMIRPRVIVPLGRFSMRIICEAYGIRPGPIGEMHGSVIQASGPGAEVVIVPMYHPAAAIYNPYKKTDILEDFQTLRRVLDEHVQ
jgi:uracil-DNA glycosylase family 4